MEVMRMPCQKNYEMNNYDVYPKVVVAGKETVIHVKPLGVRQEFVPGEEYVLTIAGVTTGSMRDFPTSADYQKLLLRCDEKGGFSFSYTFDKEQEYYLHMSFANRGGRYGNERIFPIYCVADDLVGRYPWIGDLHLHTSYSDGGEAPEVVCANYRQYGYDFLAITDHGRYFPSLQAIEFYREVPTELTIIPGEEVHMRNSAGMEYCNVHIVNFGGEYSVNALVEGIATREMGTELRYRATREDCPEVMSSEKFDRLIREWAKRITVPQGVDPIQAATVAWVVEHIRAGNGLAILAHPFWLNEVQNVPDVLLDYIVENKLFDAFEVLGGERYYEQNGFQVLRYSDDRAKGHHYPVVGSTDSHCSYPINPKGFICSTMVFSYENERKALIDSIKKFYSVAIDTLSSEYRMVGELRLVRYANFLYKYYFPLHDELCFEEGRLMKQYATGSEDEKKIALEHLKFIHGRIKRLQQKYFAF